MVSVRITDALDEDCGTYLNTKARIDIQEDLAPDVERTTLLHELTHDILFRTGLIQGRDKDDEERICDGIALGFLELIRKNPRLIEYLTT